MSNDQETYSLQFDSQTLEVTSQENTEPTHNPELIVRRSVQQFNSNYYGLFSTKSNKLASLILSSDFSSEDDDDDLPSF